MEIPLKLMENHMNGRRFSPIPLPLGLDLRRTIYRNFAWALGFNLLGLPLAAGLGAPWGLWLPPSFCGMAMASSSVLVAPSSVWLKALFESIVMITTSVAIATNWEEYVYIAYNFYNYNNKL